MPSPPRRKNSRRNSRKNSKSAGKQQRRKPASYAGATSSEEKYRGPIGNLLNKVGAFGAWTNPGTVREQLTAGLRKIHQVKQNPTVCIRADIATINASRRLVFFRYPCTYHFYAATLWNGFYVQARNFTDGGTDKQLDEFEVVLKNMVGYYISGDGRIPRHRQRESDFLNAINDGLGSVLDKTLGPIVDWMVSRDVPERAQNGPVPDFQVRQAAEREEEESQRQIQRQNQQRRLTDLVPSVKIARYTPAMNKNSIQFAIEFVAPNDVITADDFFKSCNEFYHRVLTLHIDE